MSILGDPDYNNASRIFNDTVENMSDSALLLNYIVLEVKFAFPKDVRFPSIPTRVDDDVDIYPLEGTSYITGCEYLVAKSMGCNLEVIEGVKIPFKRKKDSEKPFKRKKYYVDVEEEEGKESTDSKRKSKCSSSERSLVASHTYDLEYDSPYRDVIKGLQSKRRQHEPKTFYNLLYKTIGNSIYGQVAMGFSGKTSFDVKTKNYIRISGGDLSNPILACYITGFARALIGECLNNVSLLKGRVVSVTTDGFLTDIDDLEDKLLNMDNTQCLKLYRDVRRLLTTFDDRERNDERCDPRALEVKKVESKGLLS